MKAEGTAIYDLYVKPVFVHNRTTTPEWGFDNRSLLYHNLVYIYEGTGRFACNGVKKEVGAGDLVYFPKGCWQYMRTDARRLLKLYTVNFQAVLPMEEGADWRMEPVSFPFAFVKSLEDEAVQKRFEVLFERLSYLFMAGEGLQKVKQRETLSEILGLADLCQRNQNISYSSRDKANRAVHFMAVHYAEKLTLEALAGTAGLSPSHFSAVFRAVTGKSPIDYLIHLRVFKAKQLLSDGMRVTDVAEAVGFSDIYYFSNVFRRLEGVSPSRFRSGL